MMVHKRGGCIRMVVSLDAMGGGGAGFLRGAGPYMPSPQYSPSPTPNTPPPSQPPRSPPTPREFFNG